MKISTPSNEIWIDLVVPLLTSFFVSLTLFYIDEGNYNFSFLKEPGNLLVLCIYISLLFLGQLIIRPFLLKNRSGWQRELAVCSAGVTIGLLTAFTIFSS